MSMLSSAGAAASDGGSGYKGQSSSRPSEFIEGFVCLLV